MKLNMRIIISVLILSIFGVVMIFSSSYIWAEYKYNNPYKYFLYQSVFLIIGLIIMFIVSKIKKEYCRWTL